MTTTTEIKSLFDKANLEHDGNGKYSQKGIYCTNHGEYSRPRYSIRRYKDGMGIYIQYFYYNNTFNIPQNGRISIQDFIHRFGIN